MKIDIEKVTKVKPFEPFIVKLTFETKEDVYNFIEECEDEMPDMDEYLAKLLRVICDEMRKQDFKCTVSG
jgi:hypothetical protein